MSVHARQTANQQGTQGKDSHDPGFKIYPGFTRDLRIFYRLHEAMAWRITIRAEASVHQLELLIRTY